jgi:tetraacyldisaccharide 4'-kinase
VFPDHHKYTRDEVVRLARSAAEAGADVLVTTEKDRVNLPADSDELAKPLRIFTVAVRTRLRNENEFLLAVDNLLGWASRASDGNARH